MGSARQQGPSPLSGPPLSWPAPGAGGSSRGIRARPQWWWGSGLLWELRWKTGARAAPGVVGGRCLKGCVLGQGLVGGPPSSRSPESQQPQRPASRRSSASRSSTAHSAVNRLKKTVPPWSGSRLAWAGQQGSHVLGTGPFSPSCPALEECPPHPIPCLPTVVPWRR